MIAAFALLAAACNGRPQGKAAASSAASAPSAASSAIAGAADASAVPPLPARSNILLITVDTLRADHLSSYGYPRATSPAIDRLAAEGVRFDQATAQWPKTTPSFASLFTATYSKDNGIVRRVGIPVSCRFEMLAKVLQRQGYATQAVVANGALGSEFNFDQGFDRYIQTWKLPGNPKDAAAVTRLAIGLLDGLAHSPKPFFLWVHYIDPHFPYTPPGPWARKFQGDRFFDRSPKIFVSPDHANLQMAGIGSKQVLEGHRDLAFYVARYDAAIAYADEQIGLLLAEMKRRGLLKKTLTAFTADHGESLGEHLYYFDHGRFGFQTCLRVPLIFHYPGVLTPRVVAQPVELLNVAPTLLEAAGMALPGGVWKQGRSLTPHLRGLASPPAAAAPGAARPGAAAAALRDGHPGLVFSEAGWETNNKWQKIVREGRFKLILAQTRPEQRWIGGEGVRFTLYDLDHDPQETTNVADRFPADLERLTRELWAWENAPKFEVETEPPNPACGPQHWQKDMDPETRALLKSLGYL
jgi:arylsulfatase